MVGRLLYVTLCHLLSSSQLIAGQSSSHLSVNYTVVEEMPGTVAIGHLVIDTGISSFYPHISVDTFRFGLMRSLYKDYFNLDTTGLLSMSNRKLDRDEVCSRQLHCVLDIEVALVKPTEVFQIIKVGVTIVDVNDNAPIFQPPQVVLTVSESSLPGTTIALPAADDNDAGMYSIQTYELAAESNDFFDIIVSARHDDVGNDVHLVLKKQLDRETNDRITLTVTAFDGGNPRLSGILSINIIVHDSNDNSPTFVQNRYDISVREEFMTSDPVVKIEASDPDVGLNGQIVYGFNRGTISQHGDHFAINNTTGNIYLRKRLNYEERTSYSLTVSATDMGTSAMTSYATVVINVEDINDHSPRIIVSETNSEGMIEVKENQPVGTFVTHVSVEDDDSGVNAELDCEIRSADVRLQKSYPGIYTVTTQVVLDREYRQDNQLTLTCMDRGLPSRASSEIIAIRVLDENDNPPVFAVQRYSASLTENTQQGVVLLQVFASDLDHGDSAAVVYRFKEDFDGILQIDTKSGIISTGHIAVDREMQEFVLFHVEAADSGTPMLTSEVQVRIDIVDVNDEAPVFSQAIYKFSVAENKPSGAEIGQVFAGDSDLPPFNQFTFSIAPSKALQILQEISNGTDAALVVPKIPFTIDRETGIISSTNVLDREKVSVYKFCVVATNVEAPYFNASVDVSVVVQDENDHMPVILHPTNNTILHLPRNSKIGYLVVKIIASDGDEGNNAVVNFSIVTGNEHNLFALSQQSGELRLAAPLSNALTKSDNVSFDLVIVASDNGKTGLNGYVWTTIKILNSTVDKPAIFSFDVVSYECSLAIIVVITSITVVAVALLLFGIVYTCRRHSVTPGEEEKSVTNEQLDLKIGLCGGKTYNVMEVGDRHAAQERTTLNSQLSLHRCEGQAGHRVEPRCAFGFQFDSARARNGDLSAVTSPRIMNCHCQLIPKVENTQQNLDDRSRTSSELSTSDSGRESRVSRSPITAIPPMEQCHKQHPSKQRIPVRSTTVASPMTLQFGRTQFNSVQNESDVTIPGNRPIPQSHSAIQNVRDNEIDNACVDFRPAWV